MKPYQTFICEDCTMVFQVYGPKPKRCHCPSCGEYFAVVPYKANITSDCNRKIRWKAEELELLQECAKGTLQPYQAAIQLGRSINAVNKKVARMKAQ